MADDAAARIDALIQIGFRLARSARTGRVLLARIADAIEPEWIPRPWGDQIAAELQAASDDAREPLPFRTIERVLREAWGTDPGSELEELDPDPVAITPGAQVHRGALDGAPVAVKVLRPGLAAAVRQDLALLEGLLAPLGAAFPALEAGAVLEEVRERVLDELDLEHEASVQRRFHRALRRHPFLTVPAPVMRLSHEDVLVSEWVAGKPLPEAPDRDQAAARLVRFVLGAGHTGMVHADPHPDDVLVVADGRLAILDFGATRTVERERVALWARAVDAFAAEDENRFGDALDELGLLEREHGATALQVAKHALGELGGGDPSRLDSAAVVAARDRLFERPGPLLELLRVGTLPPEDLWPARSAAQLFGTIAKVGANGTWRELVRDALHAGWGDPLPVPGRSPSS